MSLTITWVMAGCCKLVRTASGALPRLTGHRWATQWTWRLVTEGVSFAVCGYGQMFLSGRWWPVRAGSRVLTLVPHSTRTPNLPVDKSAVDFTSPGSQRFNGHFDSRAPKITNDAHRPCPAVRQTLLFVLWRSQFFAEGGKSKNKAASWTWQLSQEFYT